MWGWGPRLAPANVPMVNCEATCLGALAFALLPGLSVDYVVTLEYSLTGFEHSSPLATMATTKHANPSDPVLGHILSIACI